MKHQSMRRRLFASTIICGALAAALPAMAAEDSTENEVVVTGSRIPTKDAVSNSPVLTVGGDVIQQQGSASTETYLNSLPQFSPNLSSVNNNPPSGGASRLDLRQLGTQRGLILLNGHRLVPGGSTSAPDISVLPPILIDRVEIITGGASAVYGADAVSGVVNFLMKDRFSGFELDAQYGISGQNDAAKNNVNLIAGGSIGEDRGHVVFAASYTHYDELNEKERAFSKYAQKCYQTGCVFNGSQTTPDGMIANYATVFGTPARQAAVTSYFAAHGGAPAGYGANINFIGFNPGGSLFGTGSLGNALPVLNYQGPFPASSGWDPNDFYGFNFNPQNLLQLPFTRYNTYGSFDYDVTDNVTAYGHVLFSNYVAIGKQASSPANIVVNPNTAATLPTDLRDLLIAAGYAPGSFPNLTIARRLNELGPRQSTYNTTAYQLAGGVKGHFNGLFADTVWHWDAYASYGNYFQSQRYDGYPNGDRVTAAINGCPTGSPVGPAPCVTLNIFGAGTITPAMAAYIREDNKETVESSIRNVEVNLAGDLFTLPAGPVGFAVGADYIDYQYSNIPGATQQTGRLLGANARAALTGGYDTREYYGELKVPLLAGHFLADRLGLEGGYRYSDYSTGVITRTWKYGGEYAPFEWLRFRALKQKAVRAPSIGELFLARAEGFPNVGTLEDPCDKDSAQRAGASGAQVLALCNAQAPAINFATFDRIGAQFHTFAGGNTGLQPETADSYTIGAVFKAPSAWPAWIQPLTVTVDYWNIDIKNVIGTVSLANTLARCYSAVYNPTFSAANAYCSNIHRDAGSGQITSLAANGFVSLQNANLAEFTADGVDFTASYGFSLSDLGADEKWGRVNLSLVGAYYNSQQIEPLPGDGFTEQVGQIGDGSPGATTLPVWKTTLRATWNVGDFAFGWRWYHIDSVYDPDANTAKTPPDIRDIPAYDYHFVNADWQATRWLSVYVGVDNLFDKQPPVFTNGFQYNTDPSTYDTLGRYFYFGARARF